MSQNETLRAALQALLDMYLTGANSGDWGNWWDVESEPQVIAARAALAQPAAPVVERADSATPFVERSAGNVSDNAAPVAPARWYCVTNYGGATLCTSRADAAEVAAEQDIAIPRHGPHRAVMMAEVRPAPVPLTDAQIDQIKAQPGCWEHVGQRIEFRYRPFARAIEAHHGITAQGEPK